MLNKILLFLAGYLVRDAFQIAKLTDVARRAGVGNATASRALNGALNVSEEARLRILAAARDLNYRPNRSAQALKGGRSGMIGMIVPRMSDLFFAHCVEAVENVANRNASLLVVLATHDRSKTTLDGVQQLLHHNVDGLVLGTSEYLTPALARRLKRLPVPAVGIDAPLTDGSIPSMLIDNQTNAQQATEHLIAHGYAHIASVQLNPKLFTMQERHRGYERAMQQAGRAPVQHTIADHDTAEALVRSYQDKHGTYAFLAGNEGAAKLLAAAAKHLGMRMPEDFGMISFDDFDLADSLESPLTVMRQPVEEIGTTAANLLFQLMQDDGSARKRGRMETVFSAEMIIRRSCGCTE